MSKRKDEILSLLAELRKEVEKEACEEDMETEYIVDEYYIFEVEDVYCLIQNNHKQPNYYTTSDWLIECAERLKNSKNTPTIARFLWKERLNEDTEIPPEVDETNFDERHGGVESLDGLENTWKFLEELYNYPGWRELITDIPNIRHRSVVELFIDQIMEGMYPPPEVLLSIAKCFELYIYSQGKMSLEEVFFGKPKRRSGNYAARRPRERLFNHFHDTLLREKARDGSISTEEIAIRFLDNRQFIFEDIPVKVKFSPDSKEIVSSFLRSYWRWANENC